jgi:diguanylate cyclase (GGDEF)-like protein
VGSNTVLHADGVAGCFFWALFIHIHMRGSVSRRSLYALMAPALVWLAILLANLFVPLVFSVDGANVYSRQPLSMMLLVLSYGYFIYGLGLYLHMRHKGGSLRFYPGWTLLLPVAVGGSVQFVIPSMPLFWPSMSVGIAGTIASLQNEDIYRDRLTGLYNRAFLEYVSSGKMKKANTEMTGLMIDLNSFKSINDRFSHAVGDQALAQAAHLVRKAVDDIGMTARYAGDEFVVVLNTRDQAEVDRTVESIRREFRAFNESGRAPYKLSASIGQYLFVPGEQSMGEFVAAVDRAMYEDKRRFYREHPEADRRRA